MKDGDGGPQPIIPTTIARQSLAALWRAAQAGELSAAHIRALQRDPRLGAQRMARSLARQQRVQCTEDARLRAALRFEARLWAAGAQAVAGVDEVGMGPLAGPVCAAAVILPPTFDFAGIDDSKKLSKKARERLDTHIRASAQAIGIGLCTVAEIDRLNIFRAGLLAMARAVWALPQTPDHLLVDARHVPGVTMAQTALIHGDRLSLSVAAASIVAKVARDNLMKLADRRYPDYGFAAHQGYGTARHLQALRALGPTPLHRRSFQPVRAALARRG